MPLIVHNMNVQDGIRRFSVLGVEFRAVAQQLTREWRPLPPPPTLLMVEFADVISEAAQAGSSKIVRDALELVEVLLVSGSDELKDAIATGLLEKLLSDSSAKKLDFEVIAPLLGDRSKAYCRAWDEFTGVKTDGLWGRPR